MKFQTAIFLGLILGGCSSSRQTAPFNDDFSDVTERGRLMYAYDAACWIATDTLIALRPDTALLGRYLAKQDGPNWIVGFGRLSYDSSAFLLAYEIETDSRMKVISTTRHLPPQPDSAFYLHAARSVEVANGGFGVYSYPYIVMVLPEKDSTLSVYYVPAQISNDTIPIGADSKFTVSGDGLRLLRRVQFHKSLIQMPRPPTGVAAMTHIHILNDLPVETDVFYVLRQRPRLPHYIGAGDRVFAIDTKGNIRIVNTR